MKLNDDITINNRIYYKGDEFPWYKFYPLFSLYLLFFSGTGFYMAYFATGVPLFFLYSHGGIAVVIYTYIYSAIFGRDEVKWMFINAGLGLLGMYTQIGWLLSIFGKRVGDYPIYVHAIPFLYFMLYTFLLRQAVLDLMSARDDLKRRKIVEFVYVVISVAVYGWSYLIGKF